MSATNSLLGLFVVGVITLICLNMHQRRRQLVAGRKKKYDSHKVRHMIKPALIPREYMVAKKDEASGSSDDSYENYLLQHGLEKSVVESHRNYVDSIREHGTFTTGASSQTETSHVSFMNPAVGLRLMPQEVFVSPEAREVPTENIENLKENVVTKYRYGFF